MKKTIQRFFFAIFAFFAVISLLTSCSTTNDAPASNTTAETRKEQTELHAAMKSIKFFFKPMGRPAAYDWLASHNELGQTFDEYLDSNSTLPTRERNNIYVLPLGAFTPEQKKIIDVTVGYLGAFYDLHVEQVPPRPFTAVNPNVRYNNYMHSRQIKTGYILNDVLLKILSTDAAALIAFTADDLYPDETMNYVFGQASMENRVGVWSLFRHGEHTNYDNFLKRTLKIAVHETGQMFSMHHCKKYECVMSGTNPLGETDSRPIDACSECMAKVCWLSDISPKVHYESSSPTAGKMEW